MIRSFSVTPLMKNMYTVVVLVHGVHIHYLFPNTALTGYITSNLTLKSHFHPAIKFEYVYDTLCDMTTLLNTAL